MTTKIQKWGNSLGIRLPKAVFESGQFSLGSVVVLNQKGSEIILKAVKQNKLSLKDIMKNISPEKFHPLTDFGLDVGKEIIE
jgi:antitoxin MazE